MNLDSSLARDDCWEDDCRDKRKVSQLRRVEYFFGWRPSESVERDKFCYSTQSIRCRIHEDFHRLFFGIAYAMYFLAYVFSG